jgi:DNA repair protein RecO (recombination protein O)
MPHGTRTLGRRIVKQLVTQAIILSRTDYGEADRILTVLTPDYGKLRLLAKGVRKVKSKLAGGIELFSVSEITYISGRGAIGTLVSTRLTVHYGRIVADLERTMAGYDFIKELNKITEDEAEAMYFELLQHTFVALNDQEVSLAVIRYWFDAQLLKGEGQMPNLHTDNEGVKLDISTRYTFSTDRTAFIADGHGTFGASEIKFLRIAFAARDARLLQQIQGVDGLLRAVAPLMHALRLSMPY